MKRIRVRSFVGKRRCNWLYWWRRSAEVKPVMKVKETKKDKTCYLWARALVRIVQSEISWKELHLRISPIVSNRQRNENSRTRTAKRKDTFRCRRPQSSKNWRRMAKSCLSRSRLKDGGDGAVVATGAGEFWVVRQRILHFPRNRVARAWKKQCYLETEKGKPKNAGWKKRKKEKTKNKSKFKM